jgi:hypothetical protein
MRRDARKDEADLPDTPSGKFFREDWTGVMSLKEFGK